MPNVTSIIDIGGQDRKYIKNERRRYRQYNAK